MRFATSASRRQFLGYTGAGVLGFVPGGLIGGQRQKSAEPVTQGVGEHKLPEWR